MSKGLFLSLVFHGVIVILLISGVRLNFDNKVNTDYAMVVDVVNISELTNVKVKKTDLKNDVSTQTKKAPKSAEKEQPKQESAKENPKEVKEKDDSEKIPDKNKKKPLKKEEVKEEKPKKTEPKKEEKTKKDDDFEKSILKSLEEEQKKKDDSKVDKQFKELADALKGDTNKQFNENLPMSMSEIDALKSQITKNWNTSAFNGAASKGMQVVVEIQLDIEGNVLMVKPQLASNSSPYYQAFVDSAVRAVKVSSPLKNLNKEKFSTWKDIEFRFDSSGMIY
jgi:hypothetical protein